MVRIEHTDPQEANVVYWVGHVYGCPVCGGDGVVQVSRLRSSGGRRVASLAGVVADCPLRAGSGDLRSLLPRYTGSSE